MKCAIALFIIALSLVGVTLADTDYAYVETEDSAPVTVTSADGWRQIASIAIEPERDGWREGGCSVRVNLRVDADDLWVPYTIGIAFAGSASDPLGDIVWTSDVTRRPLHAPPVTSYLRGDSSVEMSWKPHQCPWGHHVQVAILVRSPPEFSAMVRLHRPLLVLDR
jgi:hypothetical protein